MHQSEADERAEQEHAVRLVRALNAALVRGISTADPRYRRQELADYLTGYVAMVALTATGQDQS